MIPLDEALGNCRLHTHRLRGKGAKPRLDWEQVVRLWFACHNQHAIARRLQMRQGRVSSILRKCGIQAGRGRRDPIHRLPMKEIARRYQEGESCGRLGEDYGVDPEVIRRRLRSFGVSCRPAGGPVGTRNAQWKGGRSPTMHDHRRQSYEVAAICLGRPLPRAWIIHHIDENPKNNDPSNLLLFRSLRAHTSFHQKLLRHQAEGQLVDATLLALESGAVALPRPLVPIEFSPDRDPNDLYEKLKWPASAQPVR